MDNIRNSMDNMKSIHLEELKGSDFQIAEDMPDIQGWKIVDYTGEKVGKVRDMLFDKNAQKVRYIITVLEGDDQEVLIPIGKAQLDEDAKTVIIQGLTLRQLTGLPTYIKDNLTSEDEYAIQHLFRHYEGDGIAAASRDAVYNRETFYNNEDFNQGRFYDSKNISDDSRNQNVDRTDHIDRTDELDQTGNLNDRRNTYRADDDPIEGDVNNPLKL